MDGGESSPFRIFRGIWMAEVNKSCKRALKETIAKLNIESKKEKQDSHAIYELYLDMQTICQFGFLNDESNKEFYKDYSDYIKEIALDRVTDDAKHAEKWRKLYWDVVKLEAYWFFESFLIYMEHKRPYEKRFYEPRAKTQKIVVDDLQKLEDSKTQKMYTLSEPSRVGKSTMMVFFQAWVVLRHPFSHNALATHSNTLAKHFYKEIIDFFESNDYCFKELFAYIHPECKGIVNKSAEDLSIYFETEGDYATCCFRGCDSTWTGAIDITPDGYLLVDDLVRDRTHSLSPRRMEETFSDYLNKMVDRKNEGAKEIMIGTLWNVLDPIKRLEDMYHDNPDYVFRRIPALNEDDESNFDYEIKGFSTEYYRDMRDKLVRAGNEAEWWAKFMQKPYNREGLLFPHDELRWFNGVLPPDHQFKYVVACDVAFGGGDSVSMPIGMLDMETDWLYIIDWYFSSAGVTVTIPGVCNMLQQYEIQTVTFERNSGGLMFAQKIQEELEKRKYICACDTARAPYNIDKVGKIMAYAGTIKAKVLFLDGTKHNFEEMGDIKFYNRSPAYERALGEMQRFVTIGKNDHDDAPDGITQLCIKAYGDINSVSEVETIDRSVLGF